MQNVLMNTYNSFDIVMDKGEGVYLYDNNGNRYLDFVAGIAVNALGYGNQKYINYVTEQLNKICHCSNLYYNEPNIDVAKKLVKFSGLSKAFFCNSGAEAVEASLKLARKYGKKVKGKDAVKVIAMKNSFHGRTYGAITLTGQKKYQNGLDPLLPEVVHCEYNNIEDVYDKVDDNTCAIILELIQGEGGIVPASYEFIKSIRELCNKKDIVLIFDEVQTGIGRTGYWFAYEQYDIKPDIVALAKGLGGGFPVGAMLACEEAAKAFEPGDHASTFGGNPLAMAAVNAVLDEIHEKDLLSHVKDCGSYLTTRLLKLHSKYDCIKDVRGFGFMQGIQVDVNIKEIILKCMREGLLLVPAGKDVIRFVPPLIANKGHIEEAVTILEAGIKEALNEI